MDDATRWADNNGFTDGQTFRENGVWLYKALDDEPTAERWTPTLEWADGQIYEPEYAWVFPDGSGIIFTEAWWDLVTPEGLSSGGDSVFRTI